MIVQDGKVIFMAPCLCSGDRCLLCSPCARWEQLWTTALLCHSLSLLLFPFFPLSLSIYKSPFSTVTRKAMKFNVHLNSTIYTHIIRLYCLILAPPTGDWTAGVQTSGSWLTLESQTRTRSPGTPSYLATSPTGS